MTQRKSSRNASGLDGGNIRALRPLMADDQGWRTLAAARSSQRRAAQSSGGWQQVSSKFVYANRTPGVPARQDPSTALRLNARDARFNRMIECAQPLVARNNRRLDIPAAVQHVAQHILQTGERSFSGNVVVPTDFFLRNQTESPAHRLRRVMEGRLQRDL